METSLYHYTSMDALTKILCTDSISFWVTHHQYLNDPTEYKWGEGKAKELFPDCDYSRNDFFILSLSKRKDFLPMWAMYSGNGTGVMLELENSSAYYLEKQCCMAECMYEFDEMALSLEQNCVMHLKASNDAFRQNLGILKMLYLPYQIKHPAYKYEEEVRFIMEKQEEDRLVFKEKNGVLIPCIQRNFDKKFIKSITLGPMLEAGKDRAIKSLKQFLSQNGYEHLLNEVYFSDVPYRG